MKNKELIRLLEQVNGDAIVKVLVDGEPVGITGLTFIKDQLGEYELFDSDNILIEIGNEEEDCNG